MSAGYNIGSSVHYQTIVNDAMDTLLGLAGKSKIKVSASFLKMSDEVDAYLHRWSWASGGNVYTPMADANRVST